MGKLRFVLPIMFALIVFAGLHVPYAKAGSGTTLSAWTTTAPTIDGNVQGGEWASADTLPFGPFGNGYSGTIYMMNDGTNLYIGVILNGDDDLTSDDNARFFFDNDHGAEASPEDGDDDIISQGGAAVIGDLFYSSGTGNWDDLNGGTTDGGARNSRQGSSNMFELSHPLNSADDAHDFSLTIGDTVGFSFTAVVDGTWYTNIPGVGNYLNPSTYCNYVVNNSAYPDLVIDPNGIDVSVGSTFTIDVWIKNIPTGLYMVAFDFEIQWNPSQTELKSHHFEATDYGWTVDQDDVSFPGRCAVAASKYPQQVYWDANYIWVRLEFQCLAEGSSEIYATQATSITLRQKTTDVPTTVPFDEDEIICNQRRQVPSNPYHYVGGELFSANKLAMLSPYLTLIGLAGIVVSAAVLVKRRKL